MQVLIPNALQPAEVDEVILCPMLGRAIVLVGEDQLSLAIGRRGQNVRLASKLCGWDIEIMTREELEEQLNQAVAGFSALEGVAGELAERLVGEGFLSYDDLSVIEPEDLMRMGNLAEEEAGRIIAQAEEKAEEAEKAAAVERRRQREQVRVADAAEQAPEGAATQDADQSAGEEPVEGAAQELAGVAEGDPSEPPQADAEGNHRGGPERDEQSGPAVGPSAVAAPSEPSPEAGVLEPVPDEPTAERRNEVEGTV
jgi:N utilization substance protein A